MSLITMLLVFAVAWWVCLLPVLSIGVQNQEEANEEQVKGTDRGAPVRAEMPKKIIITTLLAATLTAIAAIVAESGIIQFR